MKKYSHLVEIDEESRKVVIYRIGDSGDRTLYTSIDLPRGAVSQDEDGFSRFASLLGENLLLDSPLARKLLGL